MVPREYLIIFLESILLKALFRYCFNLHPPQKKIIIIKRIVSYNIEIITLDMLH